jgi:3-hydroxyacyl-CoA dehydrogenase/enoyl-CoA hydratase/3-hydroxybutyryl-CoA epimerase
MDPTVKVTIDADRVATITFDSPGKSLNTLGKQVWADLDRALDEAESVKPRGVIVASAKTKSFIAGADLFEMRAMHDEELHQYLKDGQRILARLENLPCPTIAAINGDALGGGLEVALACTFRVAADDPSIKLGLPETTLGLVPGWGGTVRLPRLIGLEQSLPLMTSGKPVAPADAAKLGLVDAIAPGESLLVVAKEMVTGRSVAEKRSASPPGDVARLLNEAVAKSDPNYPAPARLIEIVRHGYEKGLDAGFAAERRGLVELRASETGKNLMRAFFLRTGAKKAAAEQVGNAQPYPVNRVAVFGGGTMGSGIAYALLRAGLPVQLIEASPELAQKAHERVKKLIDDDIAAGRLASSRNPIEQLTATENWDGIGDVDLVIEAVIEDMRAKRELFERLEKTAKPQAVLATNTSSLSVAQLAETTTSPSRVIGIHFFNPVPRMPLVEIVRTKHTDPRAAATGVALAIKLGKTPVVVNDGPGFIVNRVLMPYLSEAMHLAQEGVPIIAIDDAMKRWGMPMGPFALLDQIGLDVIAGIFKAMREPLAGRVVLPEAVENAVKRGELGRKSGRGFYVYSADRKSTSALNELLSLSSRHAPLAGDEVIQRRLMKVMCDEADRLLREGVASSADAIDLATLTGLGIAPFRGGVAACAAERGVGASPTRNL